MASFFKSAFEKLSMQNQERMVEATEYTAMQVSPQGDLFGIFVDMRNLLKKISEQKNQVKIKGRDAKAVGVAAQGIGQGIKLIAEALNAIPNGKEAEQKMNAIVTGVDALSNLGMAIFKFAGMLALSLPLLILGIPALMLAIPMVLAVGGMFWLLGKMGIDKSIKDVSTGLAIAGLAMVSLAGGIVLSAIILMEGSKYVSDKGEAGQYSMGLGGALGLMAAMVVGTGLVFALAGLVSGQIKKGAMTMLFATLPILALSLTMAIFTKAVPPTKEGWTSLGQVGALVTGIGLVMAGAGAASALILPGAAAMLVAGVALIAVSKGISAFQNVMTPEMFAKGGIFADSGNATKPVTVLGITILEGGRPMSNLEWALLSVGRAFMLPPLAIAAMYAGAPALMMSGLALMSIAKGLEKFQALDIDYDVLPGQIAKVTTVLGDAFATVGDKYPGGGGGFLSVITGSGAGTSKVAQGISAVMGMGKALAGIAAGVQHMADLRFPTKWDKDGNPIEFRTLIEDDFKNLGENTKKIVLALSSTFSEIGGNDAAKGSTWFTSSDYEKGIAVVAKMGDPLVKLAEFIKVFTDKGIDDTMIDNVSAKTKAIIRGLTTAFFASEDEGGISLSPREQMTAARAYEKYASASGTFAENFGTLKDNINDLDLEKVTEVRKMYEGLAALSKSDTNIVEEMGESMVEAIQLLAEKLSEFSTEVKTATSTAPAVTSNATTTNSNTSITPDNKDLIAAIENLQMAMSGTLPVYVTNQEGL